MIRLPRPDLLAAGKSNLGWPPLWDEVATCRELTAVNLMTKPTYT